MFKGSVHGETFKGSVRGAALKTRTRNVKKKLLKKKCSPFLLIGPLMLFYLDSPSRKSCLKRRIALDCEFRYLYMEN